MDLRQMRYFARVVELGSMGRAASELGVGTSAVSQQISRLESELSTRLLQRTSSGVVATDAGLAFLHQAQLSLRYADNAALAAQRARLSGHVSIGFGSTIAAIIGMPFIAAMQSRYPDIRLKLVETLSGNLNNMLNSRQLDLCVVFENGVTHRWSSIPLLNERIFIIGASALPGMPRGKRVHLREISDLSLVMPSSSHYLRTLVDSAFSRAKCSPNIVLEIDGLALLMDAVHAGVGATIQPGAAVARLALDDLTLVEVDDPDLYRRTLIASLSDDELSPAALAARIVLVDVVRSLASRGIWPGATLQSTD